MVEGRETREEVGSEREGDGREGAGADKEGERARAGADPTPNAGRLHIPLS